MKREEFKNWLINDYKGGMEATAAESRVSNAQKVENAFGDLDIHFSNDSLAYVLEKLKYSKDDSDLNKELPKGIVIDGDYYTGMATLRQGVKRYLDFKNAELKGDLVQQK